MLLLLPSSENPQRSILNLNGSPRFLAGANLNLRLLLTIFVCLSAAAFALQQANFSCSEGEAYTIHGVLICCGVLFWPGELAGWHWLTLCHRCDRSVPEIATVVAVAIFFATLLASLPVAKKLPLLPPLLLRSFQS